MEYEIWTDGGYNISKGIGAYAFIVLQGNKEVYRYAERVERSTNNRCELMAIINAIKFLPYGSSATVYTDSTYCIGVLDGSFRRKKNLDLMEEWDNTVTGKFLNIGFEWVKGHSGYKYNEMCDSMCNEAAGVDLNGWWVERNIQEK